MAYEDQGALQQAAPTNDANGQIQKMFQMIANKRMAEMEAQQGQPDPRQAALQQYQSALRANPAGTFTPTDQSLNTTIAGFGRMSPLAAAAGGIAAGGDMVRNLASAKYRGEVGASKAGYDDVVGQGKDDINELSRLAQGLRVSKAGGTGSGKFIQFKDDTGNTYIMNNATGERQIIPASQSKTWASAQQAFFDKATKELDPDAYEKSVEYANSVVGNLPKGSTPVDTTQKQVVPVGARGTSQPSTASPDMPPTPQGEVEAEYADTQLKGANAAKSNAMSDRDMVLKQEWDLEQKRIDKFGLNSPQGQEALRNQAELKKELRGVPSTISAQPTTQPSVQVSTPIQPAAQPKVPTGAPGITYLDRPNEARDLEAAKEQGKYGVERTKGYNESFAKANELERQLNQLVGIYERGGSKIPSGELATSMQAMRSGLAGLGVKVDPTVGLADMASALGNQVGLAQRTAGGAGSNLLPGSVSEYETKMLQKLGPGITQTEQGRMLMAKFMLETIKSQKRIAEEAAKAAQANPRKYLTTDWDSREQRIAKEESLRLRVMGNKLIEQYSGAQQ